MREIINSKKVFTFLIKSESYFFINKTLSTLSECSYLSDILLESLTIEYPFEVFQNIYQFLAI